MEAILILRAVGKGVYQVLELDPEAPAIVAAWPEFDGDLAPTPRMGDRPMNRPSELQGAVGKAYRAALRAWNRIPFHFDEPAPVAPITPTLTLWARQAGRFTRPWVARLDGTSTTYRFDRTFLEPARVDPDRWGITLWGYLLGDGFYEVFDPYETGSKFFGQVVGGVFRRVERAEVEAVFPQLATATATATAAGWAEVETEPESVGEPEWDSGRLAREALRRVPVGIEKSQDLLFVRAALAHFDGRQAAALAADEAAASFAIANEQLTYREDFLRLTGREYDPATDAPTRAEVEARPL